MENVSSCRKGGYQSYHIVFSFVELNLLSAILQLCMTEKSGEYQLSLLKASEVGQFRLFFVCFVLLYDSLLILVPVLLSPYIDTCLLHLPLFS